MTYTYITPKERILVEQYKKDGLPIKQIAINLNRHISTIYRELKRNQTVVGDKFIYDAQIAEQSYLKNRYKHPKKLTEDLKIHIQEKLKATWSPEQISNKTEAFANPLPVFKTIYNWLYCGLLTETTTQNLRHKGKSLKNRDSHQNQKAKEMRQISIWKRPKEAKKRERLGDFEIDTIVAPHDGSKACLVTVVDRKSRFAFVQKVDDRKAETVKNCLINMLKNEKVHTLTSDRGTEFYEYKTVVEQLNIGWYFADPYSSWQRGTNENTNGLIREFFPKKTDFSKISNEEIQKATDLINNRPRKCLGWKSAKEVYENNLPIPDQSKLKLMYKMIRRIISLKATQS